MNHKNYGDKIYNFRRFIRMAEVNELVLEIKKAIENGYTDEQIKEALDVTQEVIDSAK